MAEGILSAVQNFQWNCTCTTSTQTARDIRRGGPCSSSRVARQHRANLNNPVPEQWWLGDRPARWRTSGSTYVRTRRT